jgi:APA family basic amino acid/polyamine antiporter
VPGLAVIGPLTIAGCLFLFFNLPATAMLVLPVWTAIGLLIYFGYSRRNSHLGRGLVEVHETEVTTLEPEVGGVGGEGDADRTPRG